MKNSAAAETPPERQIGEDIIFLEILPRLPVKSLSRFKVVSKNWLNFLTHDPLFPFHHSKKCPNATTFFSFKSQIFYSSDDHFKWPRPRLTTAVVDQGSTNGLIYGLCTLGFTQIFICNPITKQAVYVPNPSGQIGIGLAWDPHNPSLGFTIVNPVVLREGFHGPESLQFRVYSSKTGEWRVSENASEFGVPCNRFVNRNFQAVCAGKKKKKKVYWSLIEHVMWFDIEKDVAGLVRCPDHGNFVGPEENASATEIGECEGEVSYSRMTKQGEIEIWLLSDEDEKFEWVKKHTVGLQRIIEENWNAVFGALRYYLDINEQKNAAEALAHRHHVEPLPYSGGEEVWFLTKFFRWVRNVFSFNLRTQELKVINKDGEIRGYLCPFKPTLFACPT